ncbi:PASTA domain-containing protein [Arenibacter nanhaiticus]|nr:PASTA domain-containing protein [Arenibacter nanhaiticus]
MGNFFKFLFSKSFFVQLVLALIVTVVLVIGAMQWLKNSTNHGEFVEVPDLSKMSISEMRSVVEKAKLRYEVLDSANYNPDYPRFSIIDQNPPAGNKVKENRKLYITVNPSGYQKVSIPNIIQVTQRNASAMLKAVGLEVERVSYIDKLGKDMVYEIKYKGKSISPGDKLPKTSKIELVCGNGNIAGDIPVETDSQ